MFLAHGAFTNPKDSGRDKQRRERTEAIIVLAITLILFGLLFWVATFGNGNADSLNDYWHMMP